MTKYVLELTAGVHTLKLSYYDDPFCAFNRQDEKAPGEGKTLFRVDGQDMHKVWLVVGETATGGLTQIDNLGWEVSWYALIDNDSEKVELVAGKTGAGVVDMPMPKNPIFKGQLVKKLFQTTFTTWG